jgi:hypothetical protein
LSGIVVCDGPAQTSNVADPCFSYPHRPAEERTVSRLERRWEHRWQDREELSARMVRLEEAVTLRHDAAEVWALVVAPEHAATLSPGTVARAFRVPGTPDGVGQQQCFVAPDGALSMLEVVEHVEARRAVTCTVSPPEPTPTRTTYDLTPFDGGCQLVFGLEAELPTGAALDPAGEQAWRHQARDYLGRIRTVLDRNHPPASDDEWTVPLDDAFVAAATVREQPGAVRAAAARRISAQHTAAGPWRATEVVPPPRRSHRYGFKTAAVVLAVSAVFLVRAAELQERSPAATAVLTGQGTAREPQPPRPADAQDTRLAAPVALPAGDGGWSPLAEHDGRPVGFDPCRPVHWVMREQGAPADALPLVAEAFARLGEATGLVFVHGGLTDEAYDAQRPLVQPERYGDRYAPVLVVWSDPAETDGLDGDVGGFAGAASVDPDGAGPRYVSGVVVLDTPQLQELSAGRPARLGVVLHELGHLAGLDHVADPADSMYESSGPATGYTPGALRGLAAVGNGPCFPG